MYKKMTFLSATLAGMIAVPALVAAAPFQSSNPTTSVEAEAEAEAWWAFVARAQSYRDQLRPPADGPYAGLPTTVDDPADDTPESPVDEGTFVELPTVVIDEPAPAPEPAPEPEPVVLPPVEPTQGLDCGGLRWADPVWEGPAWLRTMKNIEPWASEAELIDLWCEKIAAISPFVDRLVDWVPGDRIDAAHLGPLTNTQVKVTLHSTEWSENTSAWGGYFSVRIYRDYDVDTWAPENAHALDLIPPLVNDLFGAGECEELELGYWTCDSHNVLDFNFYGVRRPDIDAYGSHIGLYFSGSWP